MIFLSDEGYKKDKLKEEQNFHGLILQDVTWINFKYMTKYVFSSPEPLGSQGELIVYPSSRRPSVVRRRPS